MVLSLEVIKELVFVKGGFDVFGHDEGHSGEFGNRNRFGSEFQDSQNSLQPPPKVGAFAQVGERAFRGSDALSYFAKFVGKFNYEGPISSSLVARQGHNARKVSVSALLFF
jgi:hypothetical protein